ncbi:ARC6/PARC6 family protein [Synechococcus elongatus IITB7]|uniref:ARC6/PARC6 family protein n=1 Tax=Synechococcus elongatus TaxID=32046 RepID=UPI0030D0DC75
MLKNLGLTQRYKIISTLRSRLIGKLYKVEASSSNFVFSMLVLELQHENLDIKKLLKLEHLASFLNSYATALSLEALSLEESQLIAVQPWSNTPTLDQGAQISVREGRQLLLQGLEFVQAAQDIELSVGGLQSDNLTWDGKTLKILPLGAIADQVFPPSTSNLAQLASTVVWSLTHLSIEPGKPGQFWQAQIQLEDPELRQILEDLLLGQITNTQTALDLLKRSPSQLTITPVPTDTSDQPGPISIAPIINPEQPSTASANLVASAEKRKSDSGPIVAAVLAGCLGIAILVVVPLSVVISSSRNTSTADSRAAEQEQLQLELERTRRELEAARRDQGTTSSSNNSAAPPAVPDSTFSLTRDQAAEIVSAWLSRKSQVFGPPYDTNEVAPFVTGALWTDINKPNGPVQWLRNNNSYYRYNQSNITEVINFDTSGSKPKLTVRVYEDRVLYTPRGTDPNQSGSSNDIFTYDFELEGDQWMIADYRKN